MKNSLQSIIAEHKDTLILLPTNPNFDQVASALSLSLAFSNSSLIEVACPSPMVVEFNRLVGVDRIKTNIDNKNLIIKFVNYQPESIEKVSWDIEGSQFILTIAPKSGMVAPTQNQVDISYSGVSSGLVILVGGETQNDFPILSSKDLTNAKIIHVGTKELNLSGREVISFARLASSVSEVVSQLIKEGNIKINPDLATNLLMGIEEGSQSFAGNSVTAETFALVSELMKLGGKRLSEVVTVTAKDFPQGAIPQDMGQGPVPKSWLEPKVLKGTSV